MVAESTTAALDFDRAAWKAIALASENEESFTVFAHRLNEEERAVLGTDDVVYEFRVYPGESETGITDFNGGKVEVTIPFVLEDDQDPDALYVEHIKDDGTKEILRAEYDETTETLHFVTNGFSLFRIGCDGAVKPAVKLESVTNQDGDAISPENIAELEEIVLTLERTGEAADGVFMAVFYDEDGRFIKLVSRKQTLEGRTIVRLPLEELPPAAASMKVFAVNDSWQPLIKTMEIRLE